MELKLKGKYEEAVCSKCGIKGINSVWEMEDLDFISISSNGICGDCNYKTSEQRTATLNPKYAKMIAKSVKPKYACPIYLCSHEFASKAQLAAHLEIHVTEHLEEQLGLKK